MADKIQLHWLDPEATDEQILEFYKAVTGREPTPEQIEALRAEDEPEE